MKRFALVAGLVLAGPAQADNTTGNDLYRACTEENMAMAGFCIGFISGVVEGVRYGIEWPLMLEGSKGTGEINEISDTILMYCVPPLVESGQIVDIAKKHIADNPGSRHLPARGLILEALQQNFPCNHTPLP